MRDVCFALMCFLSFTGAAYGEDWKEKKSVKIGENVTLNVESNSSEQIENIVWAKSSNTFFQISENNPGDFLNGAYKSIICVYNLSSITICNATRNNMGLYTAQVKYRHRKYQDKIFYVEEYNDFCEGTTYVNGTEGQAVTLSVERSTNESEIQWIKDEIIEIDLEKEKYQKAANGSLVIKRLTKEDAGRYVVKTGAECNDSYVLSVTSPDVHNSDWTQNKICLIVIGTLFVIIIIIALLVWCKCRDKLKCCKAKDVSGYNATSQEETRDQENGHLNCNSHQVSSHKESYANYDSSGTRLDEYLHNNDVRTFFSILHI